MRRLLVIAALALVCGCGRNHQQTGIRTFNRWPEARPFFEAAGAATKVEAFRVDPKVPAGDKPAARIGGFAVTAGPVSLSKNQVTRLRTLLGNRKTYYFDLHKKCEFQPGVALRFHAADKSADLLICFTCDELGVVDEQGKLSTVSITTRRVLVELAQELFSKDREIAALTAD